MQKLSNDTKCSAGACAVITCAEEGHGNSRRGHGGAMPLLFWLCAAIMYGSKLPAVAVPDQSSKFQWTDIQDLNPDARPLNRPIKQKWMVAIGASEFKEKRRRNKPIASRTTTIRAARATLRPASLCSRAAFACAARWRFDISLSSARCDRCVFTAQAVRRTDGIQITI